MILKASHAQMHKLISFIAPDSQAQIVVFEKLRISRSWAALLALRCSPLFTESALALDHAGDPIRVNSISPGSIRTPMLAGSAAHFIPDVATETVFERFGADHPLERIGTPEEVDELTGLLASGKAGFCAGGDYLVDGGLLAGITL